MNLKIALIAIIALPAIELLSGCSESVDIRQAASALSKHYAQNPPDRGWKVLGVVPDEEHGGLAVHISVVSESDINKFKRMSRMDQFSAAKLACPTMTDQLRMAIGSDTRIWLNLRANNKKITSTICPA